MSKEKEVILEVLEMYKRMPCLWDREHPEYKSKHARINGNFKLLEVYKHYDPTATVRTLTKKVQNLRTYYFREVHKIKESLRNGDERLYEPTLWYFEALTFLGDNSNKCSDHCDRRDPLKVETFSWSATDEDDDDEEGSYDNSEAHSSNSAKKRKFTNPIVYEDTHRTSNVVEKPPHMKDEEWEIFGKSIGLQLRDLDRTQLTIAQKIISDTIYYAKFGMLTRRSYINHGTPSP